VGFGLRMLLFYVNRGGRGLSAARRSELQKAKRLMQGCSPAGRPTARRALGKNNPPR
jgi:hypothetical protein